VALPSDSPVIEMWSVDFVRGALAHVRTLPDPTVADARSHWRVHITVDYRFSDSYLAGLVDRAAVVCDCPADVRTNNRPQVTRRSFGRRLTASCRVA
jgi:hypothetical protein